MAGGLKEVRDRISSVKNTQQITKAMKMVSAAKLRRAQQAIQEVRPYANKLNQILGNILSTLDAEDAGTSFGDVRPVEEAVIVVITSDRGLAGAFNTNINKLAARKIEEAPFAEARRQGKLSILPIGKKAAEYFKKRYTDINIISDHTELHNDTSYDRISPISQYLMDRFEAGTLDRVEVVYSQFRNAAMHIPTVRQYLPVEKIEAEGDEDSSRLKHDYIFEPSKKELLEYLVPTILQTTFHSYVLDVAAGEHGARMTAMDKATENADEMLRDLKISYNKARQESITSELSEIVGGAAALEG